MFMTDVLIIILQKQVEATPFRVFGGNQTSDQVGIEMPVIGGGTRYSVGGDQEADGGFKPSAGKYGQLQ